MADEEKMNVRVPLMITPSEVAAIDDWSFANRIRSRNEAIRRLIRAGLDALKAPGVGKAKVGAKAAGR
jgi:hypothetical protein